MLGKRGNVTAFERHSVTYQVVGNKATRLVDFFCDNTRILHHTPEAIAMLLVLLPPPRVFRPNPSKANGENKTHGGTQ